MKVDRTGVSLESLKHAAVDGTYRAVLAALVACIRAACARVEEAASCGDPQWEDAWVDEECDLVENLLGIAYVVCQTWILSVTNRALQLRGIAIGSGRSFSAFGSRKEDVRALCKPISQESSVTKVDLLWALANYYKHREEWNTVNWSRLKGSAKLTVCVLRAAGLTEGCTGNLRRGAEALGNNDYVSLHVFENIVDGWAHHVLEKCRAELDL